MLYFFQFQLLACLRTLWDPFNVLLGKDQKEYKIMKKK